MENLAPEKNPLYLELKEDEKTTCLRTCPVMKLHKEMFNKEVKRLVLIGVL